MKSKIYVSTAIFFMSAMISTGATAENASQKDMREWNEMRKEAIPAEGVLAGKVKNFTNTIGRVEHLVLNEAKDDIEYVIFEVPYPYSFYTGEDGYLNYDSLDVEHDVTGGINLVVKDADVTYPPDKLKLTKTQVDDRMVSRLIGSEMTFSDGSQREVQDLLIHPKTGKVTHFVIEMKPDAVFSEEPRTVRAKNVSIGEKGKITADVSLAEVKKNQDYDADFL